MKIAVGAKTSQRRAYPIAHRFRSREVRVFQRRKTGGMEVYAALAAGLLVGYAIAREIVRRDPLGKSAVLERHATIALLVLAVLVVVILIAETHVDDVVVKLVLRGSLIFIATAAFTAGVSSFLMYAKNEED
jgi:hypothetical protein